MEDIIKRQALLRATIKKKASYGEQYPEGTRHNFFF